MGSTMTMSRPKIQPIGPPPGVDRAAWAEAVQQAAAAQVAVEQHAKYLRWKQHRDAEKAAKHRRNMAVLAILAICVGLATVGATWTVLGIATVIWWRMGHPGLDQARAQLGRQVSKQPHVKQ